MPADNNCCILKTTNLERKGRGRIWTRLLLLLLLHAIPGTFHAQPEVQKPARILFLLDASSSMLKDWTAQEPRFRAASRIINRIVDSVHAVNPDVAFAVRAFGSQYPAQDKNCYDSRLEVPFGAANDGQISMRLKYLTPMGFSPIAWSLKETAEKDFTDSRSYAYSIILITDGGESCGGDICATVTNLLEKKISFRPYILSLVDYEPLKQQYECLGRYLTVATEKDIVPAIATIINDNRKILSIRTPGLQTVAARNPPPAAVPAVKTKPILPSPAKETPAKKTEPVTKEPVPVKKEEPAPVTAQKETSPAEPEIVMPKVRQVDRIVSRNKLSRMNLLFVLPEGVPVRVPRLAQTHMKVDPDPVPVAAAPKPAASAPARPRPAIVEPSARTSPAVATKRVTRPEEKKTESKLDFTVKTEEAKESSLQIYFTNGRGRYYNTEPKMQIRDSRTGKEVKSVYRNVVGGEPTPIKLEPGTYDIVLPGAKSKANGIVIEPGKNKKYYITVGSGSLAFYYPTAPDRPVKYTALVSKRFEPGPVVKQKCEEELPYEPANYHIEINTLPMMILNVDLDFNTVKLMSIPEPGTIQISNLNNMGKVQFWYQLGDSYVPFYEMMVTGNAASQKADFLPGLYQVRYFRNPSAPFAKAEVIPFRIKSNMTTTVELEK